MDMQTLIAISLVPFFITLLLTPLVRNAFIRYNLVDEPDGARKLH
jgi:UDP-N-acetylmuramyl pentapeptide phosphotransferase/UDP-N-acetylglucosamine-1-phosphate transferase